MTNTATLMRDAVTALASLGATERAAGNILRITTHRLITDAAETTNGVPPAQRAVTDRPGDDVTEAAMAYAPEAAVVMLWLTAVLRQVSGRDAVDTALPQAYAAEAVLLAARN